MCIKIYMADETQCRDSSAQEGARVCPVCNREWREMGVGEGDHPEWDVDNNRMAQWDEFLTDEEK